MDPPQRPPRSQGSSESNASRTQTGQSPLDWSSFVNLTTPPVLGSTAGPSGSSSYDMSPYSQQQRQYTQPPPHQSPHQHHQHHPHSLPSPQQAYQGQSGSSSLNVPRANATASGSHNRSQGETQPKRPSSEIDNGLSLDPSAFSRDIRFQVPPFLSNQVGGAPSFPAGGEAWTGFSGSNFFDANNSMTPGTLFNHVFGQQPVENLGGGDQNVLEGLSGFMNNEGGWENWKDAGANATVGLNPPTAAGANFQAPMRQQSGRGPMHIDTASNPKGQSKQSPQSNSMPTSAILPTYAPHLPGAPPHVNLSQASLNFASSSTAPFAPPPESIAQIQAPFVGPSLADGPGLYSTTGFDMVGVLARVAARKEPKTVLGPVDLSCSFVVVDVTRFDAPIVYASPTFTALTGYDLSAIMGRNCRFLQSPDAEVVKGSKRKYTDNVAVAHLKRMLNAGKECQASLINYRKGGIPFINLVTVVPIPWDGTDIVYHVGFQVDLVEQPNAILRNMRDGSYQVNYTVSNPPQQPMRVPQGDMSGLTAEMLEILGPRVNAASEDGKMEWFKMVLENADDFIHVLSLKGLFQYVSPSVRRVLEYEPEDLLNKNIADICHPSDIVPLMRELKDSTHAMGDSQPAKLVNLVFRIRRKTSGYVWIECTGRLHIEAGKGRKAVILSGRAITVPTLPWEAVIKQGGLATGEFWAKVSYHGIVLHATESIHKMLGVSSEDVVGQNFFGFLPGGENAFPHAPTSSTLATMAAAFRSATTSEPRDGAVCVRHQLVNRSSGQMVDVTTVLYCPINPSSPASSPNESDSLSQSQFSRPTRSSSASSSSGSILRPALVMQVKLTSATMRPVVHPPTANMFEELETTRGTSWQYELHQLRLMNRRLKEDIASAKAKGASRPKAKKRKPEDEAGGGDAGTTAKMELDEGETAAPKHQLTAGFGFVAPGHPSPYF